MYQTIKIQFISRFIPSSENDIAFLNETMHSTPTFNWLLVPRRRFEADSSNYEQNIILIFTFHYFHYYPNLS